MDKKNGIEMCSAHNEGKSIVAERFIISKNVYIDKSDDIVNKYNNTYHSKIKMKSVDVKSNTHINSSKEINDENENTQYKIDDIVKIAKYKNSFAKCYVPNCSDEVFAINKVKNVIPWTYVIGDLKGEEIVVTFYEKALHFCKLKRI